MSADVFLSGIARTPIGSFGGVLGEVPPVSLGAASVKASLARSGVRAKDVDEVLFGNVLSAGHGQNVARQVTIRSEIGEAISATTINKVCGSGLKAVMLAVQAIRCGDADTVIAGGTESMSLAPYFLPKARSGYRMGNGELVDSMLHDGLWDVYNDTHMGVFGDHTAAKTGITREQQDDFAVESYRRALAAMESGVFAKEITPVVIESRSSTITVETDEEPGRFDEQKLRALRPVFGASGTVTAGNASSINDGAASVVVQSEKSAQNSQKPLARVLGSATYSREPEWFTLAPIGAIRRLLEKLGMAVDNVDLFEINEAFSAVTLAAMQDLDIPHSKVNIHGGAVALGHPIGASGTRTLATLINAMHEREAGVGVVSLCIGGGEAVAMAIEHVT